MAKDPKIAPRDLLGRLARRNREDEMKNGTKHELRYWTLGVGILASLLLVACGGGGGGGASPNSPGGGNPPPPAPTPPPASYVVGGTLTGLAEGDSLMLGMGPQAITLSANGGFSFAAGLSSGARYDVAITRAPARSSCRAFNVGGVIGSAAISDVRINCVPQNWGPNGGVNAAALSPDGQTLYFAGSFTRVGPQLGSFVSVDANTAVAAEGGTPLTGGVLSAVPDGNGGWFVANAQDSQSNQILRINAAGQTVPGFRAVFAGGVSAMALVDGALHVGGRFFAINGKEHQNYARLDPATGDVLAAGLTPDAPVHDFAVTPGQIYLAGSFTQLGSQLRSGLAAISRSDGGLLPWNPMLRSSNGGIPSGRLIRADANAIYVHGVFDRVNGETRDGLAALDPSSARTLAWNPTLASPARPICVMALAHGVVYAGGTFDHIGGKARTGLAALDALTGQATDWDPRVTSELPLGSRSSVCSLATASDRVYLGGGFNRVAGIERAQLAAVSASTGALLPFAEGLPLHGNMVGWLGMSGERLWIGGSFTSYGGVRRPGTAALDLRTGRPLDWAPEVGLSMGSTLGDQVMNMVVAPGGVVLAGRFNRLEGLPHDGVGAVSPQGRGSVLPWPGRSGNDFGSYVDALALEGNTLYLGGGFDSWAGQPRNSLAAVDASSFAVLPWTTPTPAYGITRLQVVRGMVLAAGGFNIDSGQAGQRMLLAFDAANGKRLAWDPGLPVARLQTWTARESQVYLVDRFISLAGAPYPEAISSAPQPELLSAWPASTQVRDGAVFVSAGQLFVSAPVFSSGTFIGYELKQRDLTTLQVFSQPDSLTISLDQHPTAMLATNSAYVLVGRFNRASGQPNQGLVIVPR
jgi:hypothetical protein